VQHAAQRVHSQTLLAATPCADVAVSLLCPAAHTAVLLGPLRAMTYVLMHGVLAASLGSMWVWHWPWQASIMAGECATC
jgi:hypothetical protein